MVKFVSENRTKHLVFVYFAIKTSLHLNEMTFPSRLLCLLSFAIAYFFFGTFDWIINGCLATAINIVGILLPLFVYIIVTVAVNMMA